MASLHLEVLALDKNLPEPRTGDCVFYQHATGDLGKEWAVNATSWVPVVDRENNGWNDILSAAWLRKDHHVEVYKHVDYKEPLTLRRQYTTRNGAWYDLGESDNDEMSSFKCQDGPGDTRAMKVSLFYDITGTVTNPEPSSVLAWFHGYSDGTMIGQAGRDQFYKIEFPIRPDEWEIYKKVGVVQVTARNLMFGDWGVLVFTNVNGFKPFRCSGIKVSDLGSQEDNDLLGVHLVIDFSTSKMFSDEACKILTQ